MIAKIRSNITWTLSLMAFLCMYIFGLSLCFIQCLCFPLSHTYVFHSNGLRPEFRSRHRPTSQDFRWTHTHAPPIPKPWPHLKSHFFDVLRRSSHLYTQSPQKRVDQMMHYTYTCYIPKVTLNRKFSEALTGFVSRCWGLITEATEIPG